MSTPRRPHTAAADESQTTTTATITITERETEHELIERWATLVSDWCEAEFADTGPHDGEPDWFFREYVINHAPTHVPFIVFRALHHGDVTVDGWMSLNLLRRMVRERKGRDEQRKSKRRKVDEMRRKEVRRQIEESKQTEDEDEEDDDYA